MGLEHAHHGVIRLLLLVVVVVGERELATTEPRVLVGEAPGQEGRAHAGVVHTGAQLVGKDLALQLEGSRVVILALPAANIQLGDVYLESHCAELLNNRRSMRSRRILVSTDVHLHAHAINLDALLLHRRCHVSDVLGLGAVVVVDREAVVVVEKEDVRVSLCCDNEGLVDVIMHLGVPGKRRLQERALLSIPVDRFVDDVPANDRRGSHVISEAINDLPNVVLHDGMELIVVVVSVGEPVWVAQSPD